MINNSFLSRKLLFAFTLLIFLAFLSSCDCDTTAKIGAVREGQSIPTNVDRTGSYTVLICPNEKVTLMWLTSNDVKSGTVTTLGNVKVPKDEETVQPPNTTTYVLEAKGDCDIKSSVDIFTVTTGITYSIKAIQGASHWEAKLDIAFYSDKIEVTKVRIIHPVTDISWNCKKIDLSTKSYNFEVGNTWTPPTASGEAIPLVGTWQFTPIPNANTSIELVRRTGDIQFEVELKCKE